VGRFKFELALSRCHLVLKARNGISQVLRRMIANNWFAKVIHLDLRKDMRGGPKKKKQDL
jgi:hypothetical protein